MPLAEKPADASGPQVVASHPAAVVYAKGFLAAAQGAGQTEALIEEFDSFIADVLDRLPKFESVLSSAIVSHENRARLLDQALAGKASPMLLNFLKVVSRHGRLDALRAIHRSVHEQYDTSQNRVPVTLVTAEPIDDGLANNIANNLRKLIGGEPVVSRQVQSNLIGGAVLRVGDMVYDGSVAMQLSRVRDQMINRSVHEIQSRRDRFRNPTGS